MESGEETHRVAIVGGGPSGASAAYFFGTANAQLGSLPTNPTCPGTTRRINTTLFERSHIGGRVEAIYPLDDPGLERIEIGAGLIYDVDRKLLGALKTFKLPWASDQTRLAQHVGIWDGTQFVIENDGTTWSQTKLLWRYGRSPAILLKMMRDTAKSFAQLYSPQFLHHRPSRGGDSRLPAPMSGYPWASVANLARAVLPSALLTHPAHQHIEKQGVSALFMNEMGAAAVRANYLQDVAHVNAFAGLYAFEAGESRHVSNGNQLLFENMVNASGADIHMGVSGTVTGIMRMYDGSWWVGTADGRGAAYDSVVVAAPWENSGIALLNTDKIIHLTPYRRVHVTVVATSAARPRASFFGQKRSDESMPQTVLTTPAASSAASNATQTPLISLSYVREISPQQHQKEWGTVYIVRILSEDALDDRTLSALFGEGTVVWTRRKEWAAFPDMSHTAPLRSFEVDTGLYHISAIEQLISTMETSVIGAKNVAALILRRWLGDVFLNGENCHWGTPTLSADWSGWGCHSS